jgi:hypothetical protein
MTSEARPDEYEALWRKANDAGVRAHAEEMFRSDNGVAASMVRRQAAASILRDHVEAKLAEVRAERDDALALGDRQLDLGKQMLESLADRDRTIAEQAEVIERLRSALTPFGRLADEVDIVAEESGVLPCCVAKACRWEDLEDARTALQETTDGK